MSNFIPQITQIDNDMLGLNTKSPVDCVFYH